MLPGDYNLDGTIDDGDYGVWRLYFGELIGAGGGAASSAGASVPEPACCVFFMFGAALLFLLKRH